ncbi:MAG: glycosyltransferase family protein [Rhodospirillales bacterium]|nr:glycosyltransferase family protein [Rhodospirillales bacterium]
MVNRITVEQALEMGLSSHKAGRLEEAASVYQSILNHRPDHPQALHYMGSLALAAGQAGQAFGFLSRSIQLLPSDAGAHSDLGFAMHQLGHVEDAKSQFRRSIELDPNMAQPYCNLGVLLKGDNSLDEAAAQFRRALSIDPDFAQAHSNLAGVLVELGQAEDAINHCQKAVELAPEYAEAYCNLGAALKDLDRFEDAVDACRKAIQFDPNFVQAHANLGAVLQDLGDLEGAKKATDKALELDPGYAAAYYNLGNIRYIDGDLDGAVNALERAIELQQNFADAHLSLGRIHLRNGDLQKFWSIYALRWYSKNYRSFQRDFPLPKWDGSPLAGKSVLLWGEQGIGDELFFAGLVPEIAGAAARVVLETEPRLVPLFARSFPGVEVVARDFKTDLAFDFDAFDVQAPLGDLPRWLKTSFEGFEPLGSYLKADPNYTEQCRRRYQKMGDGPIIGISWSSKATKRVPLELWQPILAVPGVNFVSLQYGEHSAEIAKTENQFGVQIHVDAEVDPLTDMDGFAAQVAAMDIIVTIDNSTLAVAAGLNKPSFVLLPASVEWRYLEHEGKNPWHTTLHQFRQDTPGDWSGPVALLADAIKHFLDVNR